MIHFSITVIAKVLSVWLMTIAIIGTSIKTGHYITFLLETSESSRNATSPLVNISTKSNDNSRTLDNQTLGPSTWDSILGYSCFLYEVTFPIVNSEHFLDTAKVLGQLHMRTRRVQISEVLTTLLPSVFLFKGTHKGDYSSCQFWYFIQVGSLLLCSLRMTLVILLGSAEFTSNLHLISMVLGLGQLWLVQNFMERLKLSKASSSQTKHYAHAFAMNDGEFEPCKV